MGGRLMDCRAVTGIQFPLQTPPYAGGLFNRPTAADQDANQAAIFPQIANRWRIPNP